MVSTVGASENRWAITHRCDATPLVHGLREQPAAPMQSRKSLALVAAAVVPSSTVALQPVSPVQSGSKSTSTQPYPEMSTARTRSPAPAIAVSMPRSK